MVDFKSASAWGRGSDSPGLPESPDSPESPDARGSGTVFLHRILNSIPAMASYVDRELRYRFVNETYESWTGRPSGEIVGRHLRDVFDGATMESIRSHLERVLSGETVRYEAALSYRQLGVREVGVTYVPDMPAGETRARGFLVLVQDLSELRNKERLISEQREKMISSAKLAALGEMAGGISHEINNPLAIIHAKSVQIRNLAQADALDPVKVALNAGQIEQMSMRISKIIKALRAIARDGQDDPVETVHMVSLLRETLEVCRERFRDRGIQLTVEWPDPDLRIQCRLVQISQVILNLLNNAHDAVVGAPEKQVELAARDLGTGIEISVSDSGPGVPVDLKDRIFLPFVTTKDVGKGMGLGLSVSKSIVDAHSGSLFLDSSSARTRFVVRLPGARGTQE